MLCILAQEPREDEEFRRSKGERVLFDDGSPIAHRPAGGSGVEGSRSGNDPVIQSRRNEGEKP
jgi:hypothetical protein